MRLESLQNPIVTVWTTFNSSTYSASFSVPSYMHSFTLTVVLWWQHNDSDTREIMPLKYVCLAPNFKFFGTETSGTSFLFCPFIFPITQYRLEWKPSNHAIPCVRVFECEKAPLLKHLMHNHEVFSVNIYLTCIPVFVYVSMRSIKYYVKS